MITEGLVPRVKRLISGSVNSMVDAVENAAPETVMTEAIREVDQAIDEVRDQLGLAIANKHHASKRLMEANSKHEDLSDKLRLAVAEGRDDLAEAAIARQLDLEAQIPILEDALKEASTEEAELETYVAALNARRREMQEDLEVFLASRQDTSSARPPGGEAHGTRGGHGARADEPERQIDAAEKAFDRVLRGATRLPGTAPADRETAAKLVELEKISRDNRIKERLAAVKAVKRAD
ncbi:MAG: PspA/IM30 family protein [Pseudomonadota bacterium]